MVADVQFPKEVERAALIVAQGRTVLEEFYILIQNRTIRRLLVMGAQKKYGSENGVELYQACGHQIDKTPVMTLGGVLAQLFVATPEETDDESGADKLTASAVSLDVLARLARECLPRGYRPATGLPSRRLVRACLVVFHYHNMIELLAKLEVRAGQSAPTDSGLGLPAGS